MSYLVKVFSADLIIEGDGVTDDIHSRDLVCRFD